MSDISVVGVEKMRYFFNPWVDFMALGGGSVIVLLAIALFMPKEANISVIAFMLFLTHFINHPHFAHSYQIFYSHFFRKLLGAEYSLSLRLGYWFAGIAVPILLIVFFVVNYFFGNQVILGLAVNAMLFLSGWHFVKQGYGILMADSVLKKRFFSGGEKNMLLINAYTCWLSTWVYANQVVRELQFYNVHYYTFDAPDILIYVLMVLFAITSVLVLGMLCARLVLGKGVPFNGVVAYFVSLYVWVVLLKVNPLFAFVIPAFHSLQYFVIVWRYRINYAKSKKVNVDSLFALPFGRFFKSYTHYQMTFFIFSGLLMGYFGFWGIPYFMGDIIAYDSLIWSSSIFIVMCWVFINVHHYFIDSVIWRRGNKDVFQHLFSDH